MKNLIIVALLAGAVAVQAAAIEHKLPAPMPEFKSPAQLAQWRQEKTAAAQKEVAPEGQPSFFYTGKPFVADTGTYAFKYRDYDPAINRWTTADPSGFPDGVNNSIYAPVPTSALDFQGLITVSGTAVTYSNELKGMLNGLLNWAAYSGEAWASSSGLNMTTTIQGYSTLSWIHELSRSPSISVGVDQNGNLSYTPSGSFGGADGVVGAGLSYTVEGAGTRTLTFHVWGAWALSATTVSGIGASATGGSISFSGATMSDGPVALGTFTFTE